MTHIWNSQKLGFHLSPKSRGLGHARKANFGTGSSPIGTRTLRSIFSMGLGSQEQWRIDEIESVDSELSLEPLKSCRPWV